MFYKKNEFLGPAAVLKKRLWYRCFPVNFAKFSRTPLLQDTCGGFFYIEEVIICEVLQYRIKNGHMETKLRYTRIKKNWRKKENLITWFLFILSKYLEGCAGFNFPYR